MIIGFITFISINVYIMLFDLENFSELVKCKQTLPKALDIIQSTSSSVLYLFHDFFDMDVGCSITSTVFHIGLRFCDTKMLNILWESLTHRLSKYGIERIISYKDSLGKTPIYYLLKRFSEYNFINFEQNKLITNILVSNSVNINEYIEYLNRSMKNKLIEDFTNSKLPLQVNYLISGFL